MRLQELSHKDRPLFEQYLGLKRHKLSVYSFDNIYVWRAFFKIEWCVIRESLCVFFTQYSGTFMYLPPLGGKINGELINSLFDLMNKRNTNKDISRIENVEKDQVEFFRGLGFRVKYKSSDYLCRQADLAQLSGSGFKHKRSSCNNFEKNNSFTYEAFSEADQADCLKLYNLWMNERLQIRPKDDFYKAMLEDSRICLKTMLNEYDKLEMSGRIVKVKAELKGFTFGFELDEETFCIFFEITDLNVKGLAQYIFREFSRELNKYKFINIMDDSGLPNLKKVKLSYHPAKVAPSFIITCTGI